ncbi:hypothetical protein BGX26_002932 [Mortierella sp. AD094]|nr:hypothetical protein BGX26_002932 [Mortierella sp. AD094]
MKSGYSTNFDEFTGAPWVLSTGTNVDDVIFRYTMTLSVESSLHSFVLDRTDTLVDLFEQDDQHLFQGAIDQDISHEAEVSLTEWKQREIMRYSLGLDKLYDLLSHGWNFADQEGLLSAADKSQLKKFRMHLYMTISNLGELYKRYDNKLPEFRPRSWFSNDVWKILVDLLVSGREWLKWIEFLPGDIPDSSLSSDLEALEGELEGVITCKSLGSEVGIAAIKIGENDYGPTGIKALKDMFDLVCGECSSPGDMRTRLRVYGILFSGLRVEFVSLKYVSGRFYRLTREKTLSIPITWDDQSVKAILDLVKEILVLRDRMESMAKVVYCQLNTEGVLCEFSGSSRPILSHSLLKAHKPCSASDILDAAAAANSSPTSAAIMAAQSSNFSPSQGLTQALRSTSTDAAPLILSPLSTVAATNGASSPISPSISRTGSMNHIPSMQRLRSDSNTLRDSATTSGSLALMTQTRTIHPQVHYIFEDDPLESEILESIPKSRYITLDLDPRTGTIKNVESFLTNLQVMDVKLVPFQSALTTSSSTSSLNPLTINVSGSGNINAIQINDSDNSGSAGNLNPALGRVGSSGPSSLQSSMTVGGRLSERGLANQSGGGGESIKNDERMPTTPNAAGPKDWTLVIEAVEVEEKEQDSDSELLDQSMISSLDTDTTPEDYLSHCDALLKSFNTRNLLVQKVIDYAGANSSLSGGQN